VKQFSHLVIFQILHREVGFGAQEGANGYVMFDCHPYLDSCVPYELVSVSLFTDYPQNHLRKTDLLCSSLH
jgi:hypothetical protein